MLQVAQNKSATTTSGQARKYTVLMELGSGGCATVSAAMATGIAGFSKVVVLKAIRRGVEDPNTKRMFFAEARLSARMNHPNVVQVYEVFEQDGLPVIVMEYLDGQSLATVLRRCHFQPPSPQLALSVLCKVLTALHYAHTLTEYSGEALNLVHRDVSPHNVMITYDGQVKLVDFGIAKMTGVSGEETRTGVVKGKVNYMAPEQLQGTVDHRADIFAVGVMMWEMLAGRRLWPQMTDAAIIGHLMTGEIPHLGDVAPDVDPTLQRICDRALAPLPEFRYSNAEAMLDDIELYLQDGSNAPPSTAVASWVAIACGDLQRKSREALRAKIASLAESVTGELELGEGNEIIHSIPPPSSPIKKVRSNNWAIISLAIGLALLSGWVVFLSLGSHAVSASPQIAPRSTARIPAAVAPVRVKIAASPLSAEVYLDGKHLPSNPFLEMLPRDDAVHTLRVQAKGFETLEKVVRFDANVDVSVSLRPESEPLPQAKVQEVRDRELEPDPAPPAKRPVGVSTAPPRPAIKSTPPSLPAVESGAPGTRQVLGAEPGRIVPGADLSGLRTRQSTRVVFDDPYAD